MTSLEEKEKGAAAWTANNYPLAITHFTKAIEIGGDKDFLKVSLAFIQHSSSQSLTTAIPLFFEGYLLQPVCGEFETEQIQRSHR